LNQRGIGCSILNHGDCCDNESCRQQHESHVARVATAGL
jgi:hypothetical protein